MWTLRKILLTGSSDTITDKLSGCRCNQKLQLPTAAFVYILMHDVICTRFSYYYQQWTKVEQAWQAFTFFLYLLGDSYSYSIYKKNMIFVNLYLCWGWIPLNEAFESITKHYISEHNWPPLVVMYCNKAWDWKKKVVWELQTPTPKGISGHVFKSNIMFGFCL